MQCGLVLMDFASNGELYDAIVRPGSNGKNVGERGMQYKILHA